MSGMRHYFDLNEFGRLGELQRRRDVSRARFDPMTYYTDEEFRQRYRFSKEGVEYILNLIRSDLEAYCDRNRPLSAMNQLLITLSYYATGAFQLTDGDLFSVHQTTVSRIVHKVSRIIASLSPIYIRFPSSSEQNEQMIKFYQMAQFPGVIGLIDGTHIQIQKPSTSHSELYRNRKSFFSINTQLMMDFDFRINDIVCRWYGSAHDSRIFENSSLYSKLENLSRGSWLLGDSGYACLPFLMTPFVNARNRSQQRYNISHKRTRNLIERGIGVWKRRFPIIKYGLRIKTENCPPIIVACAVLHNIAIQLKEDEFHTNNENLMFEEGADYHVNDANGNAVRQTIVDRYFSD